MRSKKRYAAVGMLVSGLLTIGMGFALEPAAADQGGPNEDCPAGTIQVAKFEWKGSSYAEDPVNSNYPVTITAGSDTESVSWTSTVLISAIVIKGGTNATIHDVNPDAMAGSFNNPHDPAISNVKFCGPGGSSSSSSSSTPSSSTSSSATSSSSTSSSSTSSTSSSSTSSTSSSSTSSQSSVSSSSTTRTTTVCCTQSSSSSTSQTSSEETSSSESSPSVSGSSLIPSSQATSTSPQVSGVQIPQALPQTGMDPGFLLMLGGMLVIAGLLFLRYSSDAA